MRREHKDTVFELSTLANQPFQGPVGALFFLLNNTDAVQGGVSKMKQN